MKKKNQSKYLSPSDNHISSAHFVCRYWLALVFVFAASIAPPITGKSDTLKDTILWAMDYVENELKSPIGKRILYFATCFSRIIKIVKTLNFIFV